MKIYQINAREILDSRKEPTILVSIETDYGNFETSAPSGKSKGRHEAKPHLGGIKADINVLNRLKLQEILCFRDLRKVERICKGRIGANSLFALEASLLKALAQKNKKELWQFLNPKKITIPRPVGNAVGGGMHSQGIDKKKPDFQEFLFTPNANTFSECVDLNQKAYNLIKKFLKTKGRSDEGAWQTSANNKDVLEAMNKIKQEIEEEFKQKMIIGVDAAASSFYKKIRIKGMRKKQEGYVYKNPKQELDKRGQIEYVKNLINQYNIFYIEDPLNEDDFSGFSELNKGRCFIVGDDLTATNLNRLKRAVRTKAIKGIIIKPNQIGSLVHMKKVIEFAKMYRIQTIMSHRSGETNDDTISDLAVGFKCDFIKTGIYGSEREAKLKRLIEIEKNLNGE